MKKLWIKSKKNIKNYISSLVRGRNKNYKFSKKYNLKTFVFEVFDFESNQVCLILKNEPYTNLLTPFFVSSLGLSWYIYLFHRNKTTEKLTEVLVMLR